MHTTVDTDVDRCTPGGGGRSLVLCLSLIVIVLDNTILNVALPTLVARPRRHAPASSSGSSTRYIARVRRPAAHRRQPRRPLRPQGRAAARPGRLRRRLGRCRRSSTRSAAAHRHPGAHGRRRRVRSCRRPCRSSPTSSPTRRSGPGPSASGPASPALGIAIGPIAGGCLLEHFCVGLGLPGQRARSCSSRLVAGPLARARRRGTRPRPGSTRSARCCRSSGWSPLLWAIIEAPDQGLDRPATARRRSPLGAVAPRRVRRLGAAQRRTRCSTCAFFRNPRFTRGQPRRSRSPSSPCSARCSCSPSTCSSCSATPPLEAGVRIAPVGARDDGHRRRWRRSSSSASAPSGVVAAGLLARGVGLVRRCSTVDGRHRLPAIVLGAMRDARPRHGARRWRRPPSRSWARCPRPRPASARR